MENTVTHSDSVKKITLSGNELILGLDGRNINISLTVLKEFLGVQAVSGIGGVVPNEAYVPGQGSAEAPAIYFATPGTYTGFNGAVVESPLAVLSWDGSAAEVMEVPVTPSENKVPAYVPGTSYSEGKQVISGGRIWEVRQGQTAGGSDAPADNSIWKPATLQVTPKTLSSGSDNPLKLDILVENGTYPSGTKILDDIIIESTDEGGVREKFNLGVFKEIFKFPTRIGKGDYTITSNPKNIYNEVRIARAVQAITIENGDSSALYKISYVNLNPTTKTFRFIVSKITGANVLNFEVYQPNMSNIIGVKAFSVTVGEEKINLKIDLTLLQELTNPTTTSTYDISPLDTSNNRIFNEGNLILSDYVMKTVTLSKSEMGFEKKAVGTEAISELIGSDVNDVNLWAQGGLSTTNGSIQTGSIISPSSMLHSVKYYPIYATLYNFLLGVTSTYSDIGLVLYDENFDYLAGFTSYQVEQSADFDIPGAKYVRISHHKDVPTTGIYVRTAEEVTDENNLLFSKRQETPSLSEFEQLSHSVLTKEEAGYDHYPARTEWLTELIGSDPLDENLWNQDSVWQVSTGNLVEAVGFSSSKKKYPLPKGDFDFTLFLQVISGNTGLVLWDINSFPIRSVVSLREFVKFNSDGAAFFTISHRNALPTSAISLKNDKDIFVKKYDANEGVVFNRFFEVEQGSSFPAACNVGKFKLIRDTDTKTGDVYRDYDIQGSNYPKLGKAKIISTKELQYPIMDVDNNGNFLVALGNNIRISDDGGTSYSILASIPEANSLFWVASLENGELIAFDETIRGATPETDSLGGVYVSTNGRTIFTKVHTYRNRYIQPVPSWTLEQNGSDIYFSEYGNSAAAATADDPDWDTSDSKANATRIWRSTNYGVTFSEFANLEDLPHLFPADGRLHIHGLHYDRYWNRLWVTTGDGGAKAISNKKLAWTDDDGGTWNGIELSNYYAGDPSAPGSTPYENLQGLSMISTNEVLLIGADCFNNAIFRVSKRKRNEVYLEDAYYSSPGIIDSITYFTGRFTRYSDSPIFIPLGRGDAQTEEGKNSRFPKVVATWDGVDFVEIWKDNDTPQGIPQQYLRVWKLKGRYYIHAQYPNAVKNYLIEIEL